MIKNKESKIISFFVITLLLTIIPLAIASPNLFDEIKTVSGLTFFDNTTPNPPEINGPMNGKAGTFYDYTFTLTDPDEDDTLTILEVDFGNTVEGSIKRTCEQPWVSGTEITITHQWEEQGNYSIIARVLDVNDDWSEWSDPFLVSMPKIKSLQSPFQNFLENHPYLLILLQQLLRFH